jgi:hypothetical protein
VTPSPRLEDLRQGPRMPGHASYSHSGTTQAPVFTTLDSQAHAGTPQGRPAYPSNSVKSKYPCVHNIRGIRGITLVEFPLDVSVKVNSKESPSMGSHLMCCMIALLPEVGKEESPSMTTIE